MFKFIKNFFSHQDLNANKDLKDKFSKIYFQNIFGGKDSRSGEGSNMEQTAIIRRELPNLLKRYGINSLMDAPCGDFYWMREVDLGIQNYLGVDIVDSLIQENIRQYGSKAITFSCIDLVDGDLPKVDLALCRDCLVHLTFEDAKKVVENFKKSGIKYLLTTSFTRKDGNVDLIGKDIWRPLNLELTPFNFPKPLEMINEGCTEYNGQFSDKHLGLWLLDEISFA